VRALFAENKVRFARAEQQLCRPTPISDNCEYTNKDRARRRDYDFDFFGEITILSIFTRK